MSDHSKYQQDYTKPAGGFDAIRSVTSNIIKQKGIKDILTCSKTLSKINQPNGFDCPGCAWPEPEKHKRIEFCENGVKHLVSELTPKRITADFFNSFTVTELQLKSDFWLEEQGRLTEPMSYNPQTDKYEAITWQQAFETISNHLQSITPNEAIFYTSGRLSNEASFLYQLFVRLYGTNNLPDCSNMCHEASGRALTPAIGTGKGMVTLDELPQADCIFSIGHNPGSNTPRMLSSLKEAVSNGAKVITINPLKERGLKEVILPQDIKAIATNHGTKISSLYLQPKISSDFAIIRGIAKYLFESAPETIDTTFINEHTHDFETYKQACLTTQWSDIEEITGLTQKEIEQAAEIYSKADKTIISWSMGVTQNAYGVETIQEIINLLLLRGDIGRPGTGPMPIRGHSNVQGNRTQGIAHHPSKAFLENLGKHFNFQPPTQPGFGTVEAIKAMHDGKAKFFLGMGGNFALATPDPIYTQQALAKCDLTVQVSTKINRSHLAIGKQALILPCLARSELDLQNDKPQSVTVENSMSIIHASTGSNQPASENLHSEVAIIAKIADTTLPNTNIDWQSYINDYDSIRDDIAKVIPEFENMNQRLKDEKHFRLVQPARQRQWLTSTNKANFITHPLPSNELKDNQLMLMTMRSHDQWNTTIYSYNDRYRGVKGNRMLVFMNIEDMKQLNLKNDDKVIITSFALDGSTRQADNFQVIAYDIPRKCAAAYFPEANCLIPIDDFSRTSEQPMMKQITITVEK